MEQPLFTIIIPTYNSAQYIEQAITSIQSQTYHKYEIIVVDDCSGDDTYSIVQELGEDRIRLFINDKNYGPGVARNVGLDNAGGEYVIFLDSDDMISENLLGTIAEIIANKGNFDICDYNFTWKTSDTSIGGGGRKDIQYLRLDRKEYLKKILRLHTDAQVIFTCYRKKFLDDNHMRFAPGFHEDVAFFFKAYYYAKSREVVDFNGYIKTNREDSIVNTCSEKHIIGFFTAWEEIRELIKNQDELVAAWKDGIIAIGAIKIRDILTIRMPKEERKALYSLVGKYIQENISDLERNKHFQTKYYKMVETVLTYINHHCIDVNQLEETLQSIVKSSWSCWDIQNSLFLAPTELRVCCKRFFVDGKQKGDLVLAKLDDNMTGKQVFDLFLREKPKLHMDINKGEKPECMGCPYLSFQQWDNAFGIKKISFEYHSLCNLRCTYCSEKYYGAATPCYDVVGFTDRLIKGHYLDDCESVVWGGGEPSIEENFVTLINKVTSSGIYAKHNVITNATMYIPEIAELLEKKTIHITTSVDAGTSETYEAIRGRDFIKKVFCTLSKYAMRNAAGITIKYIVMEPNCTLPEIRSFIANIEKYGLKNCNFQISFNFKKEEVSFNEKVGIVVLYGMLKDIGVKIVFLDELLRERMTVTSEELEKITDYLGRYNVFNPVLRKKVSNIVIWGSENQIQSLLHNTLYFSEHKPIGLIAGHTAYLGKNCEGIPYLKPEAFIDKDVYIIIAAVQGTRRIYEEYLNAGFQEERLISDLIL